MAKRKTIEVRRLIEIVNKLNETSTGERAKAIREGANSLLSTVLSECDVYAGFAYLEHVPAGEMPGIIRRDAPAETTFPDETRISFYVSRKL